MQRVTATLLVSSLLTAATSLDESVQLRFAPVVDTSVDRELRLERQVEGGDLAVEMNGGEVPQQFLPELKFEYTSVTAAKISDTFLKPEEGIEGTWRKRTVEDARELFSMEMSYSGETTIMDSEASCDLEGEAFLIGRDGDGDVVARWADDSTDRDVELLAKHRPELDLAALLPEDAVKTDSTWEADASALAEILNASAYLPWTWSGTSEEEIPESADATYEGTLDLRAVDIRSEDGAVLITIQIQGDVVEISTRATDLERVPVADGTATETTTMSYTVEGELVWNATAHLVQAFTLEGEGAGEQVVLRDADQPGPTYRSTTQHKGTFSVSLR